MNEIELKFLVPTGKLNAIKRQTHIKSAIENQLSAHYFDTPERQLAKNGIAIRIRQEIENPQPTGQQPLEQSGKQADKQSCEQWIQTCKTSGDGMASRLEHNYILDSEQAQADFTAGCLRPDLSVYADTPISKVLKKLSKAINKTVNKTTGDKQLQDELTLLYSTDVHRTTRLIKKTATKVDNTNADNSVDNDSDDSNDKEESQTIIEVAFDTGEVSHRTETGDKCSQPLQEIEFELLEGNPQLLFEMAKIWCKRYSLCLSTITKAERGGLVMAGQQHPKAVKANLKQYHASHANQMGKKTTKAEFLRAVVHNCLLQILPNASAIVAGALETGNDKNNNHKPSAHVHQLRVGIRRLRTALRFFADFSEQVNPQWLPILTATFGKLGEYRDREILLNKTQPMLEELGAPSVDWTAELLSVKDSAIQAVKSNDFQLTLLELIEFAMSNEQPSSQSAGKQQLAKPAISKILNKLFAKISKASSQFATLELEAQHDVRKRLKALRYISEFALPLYLENEKPAKKEPTKKKGKKLAKKTAKQSLNKKVLNKQNTTKQYKTFVKQLKPAQEVLGNYNDNIVGHDFYAEKAKTEANAYFAVGWFLAEEKRSAIVCAEQLQTMTDVNVFWK